MFSKIFRKEPFFHGHDNYDQVSNIHTPCYGDTVDPQVFVICKFHWPMEFSSSNTQNVYTLLIVDCRQCLWLLLYSTSNRRECKRHSREALPLHVYNRNLGFLGCSSMYYCPAFSLVEIRPHLHSITPGQILLTLWCSM